MALQPHI
jgi:hypothetical protein